MLLLKGNCLDELKKIENNSVDSIVTDPPYGLNFMGKKWDYDVPSTEIWSECLRVLKPGGHLLAFFGTRTYHRGVVRIEDAGFEIRDQIAWLYGQGFPKSTNVLKSGLKQGLFCECKKVSKSSLRPMPKADISKTFDFENERGEILQQSVQEQSSQAAVLRAESEESFKAREESSLEGRSNLQTDQRKLYRSEICEMSKGISSDESQGRICDGASPSYGNVDRTKPDSNGSSSSQRPQHAKQQDSESGTFPEQSSAQTCGSCGKKSCEEGLGTALKPSIEPICVARKPLEKGLTVAENVVKWGTGAINIDGSRIALSDDEDLSRPVLQTQSWKNTSTAGVGSVTDDWKKGRWPANVIFDEEAAQMLDEQSGTLKSGKPGTKTQGNNGSAFGAESRPPGSQMTGFGDKGGASRFFYVAKASKSERNAGLEGMEKPEPPGSKRSTAAEGRKSALGEARENFHPTVKPIKLMEYLIKLVTPPNGTVLDPFMGSGSTGVAAKKLGFKFIGYEISSEYFEIAKKRIEASIC